MVVRAALVSRPCLELFSTAPASATILSLNARLYDVRQALGMMTT